MPSDNPYVGVSGVLPEIFTAGLRNPLRWSIDLPTGQIWEGDVGQDAYEEVNVITAGGNFGWPYYEGPSRNPNTAMPPAQTTFSAPAYSCAHNQGLCIT
ncbi:MAG: glucose sorbosone dehydrogenase, partial [Deltaproteobacteria bacterium]